MSAPAAAREVAQRHALLVCGDVLAVLRTLPAESADGTLWLNLGDSYCHAGSGARDAERWPKQSRNDHRAGHPDRRGTAKPKDLLGVPWRLALALQAAGWWLRRDIIWSKPNPMPESVADRPTTSHEYLFLFARSRTSEHGCCRRCGAPWRRLAARACGSFHDHRHDAAQGQAQDGARRKQRDLASLARPREGAGWLPGCDCEGSTSDSPVPAVVLDPFSGAGTTALVALRLGREALGIDLNPDYCDLARRRLERDAPLLNSVSVETR